MAENGGTGTGTAGGFADLEKPDMPWHVRILLGCFIFGIIGLFTIIGIMTPGVGWFLYLFLIPFWGAFPMMVVGSQVGTVLLGIYLVVAEAAGRTSAVRVAWLR